jgi:hypothetical protein
MTFMKRIICGAVLLGVVALTVGTGSAPGAKPTTLDHVALCGSGNTFTADVNNLFFPLPNGRVVVFTGKDQGQTISVRMTVKGTFLVGSVTTRILEEFEWSDTNGDGVQNPGEPDIEVSQNYFAQTTTLAPGTAGTVCYFGEDVVPPAGSWRASDSGNFPGIFMPANPTVGQTFQQEGAPLIAEDTAKVVHRGAAKVGGCTFPVTVRLQETNPIDGGKGFKTYAQGIGMIRDGALDIRLNANCQPA